MSEDRTIRRLARALLDAAAWPLSRARLRACAERAGTEPEAVLRALEEYAGLGSYRRLRAVQHPGEILELARTVQAARPRVIVEIGTHLGGTLFLWCRTNPHAELVASIDLPAASGGYETRRERLYREFVRDRPTDLLLLRGNSHDPATGDALRARLAERPIDFLFIDGDHSYAGVRRDYELFAPLVRRGGGIIAFHDIVTRGPDHQVPRFWQEVRAAHPHREIVRDPAGRMGIGLLFPAAAGLEEAGAGFGSRISAQMQG